MKQILYRFPPAKINPLNTLSFSVDVGVPYLTHLLLAYNKIRFVPSLHRHLPRLVMKSLLCSLLYGYPPWFDVVFAACVKLRLLILVYNPVLCRGFWSKRADFRSLLFPGGIGPWK